MADETKPKVVTTPATTAALAAKPADVPSQGGGGSSELKPAAEITPSPGVTEAQTLVPGTAHPEGVPAVQAVPTVMPPLPNTPTFQQIGEAERGDLVRIKFLTGYDRYNAGEIAGFTRGKVQKIIDAGLAIEVGPDEVAPLEPASELERVRLHSGPPTAVSVDSEPSTVKRVAPGVALSSVLKPSTEAAG